MNSKFKTQNNLKLNFGLKIAMTFFTPFSLLAGAMAFAQFPPPGIAGPSGPGGPPKGVPAGFAPPPLELPMTPAQKRVDALTPPGPGGILPVPPLGPDDPVAVQDARNFDGTWIHNQSLEFRMQRDMYRSRAPYTAAGAEVLARRVGSLDAGAPFINASATCRPPGPQWQRDLNFQFFSQRIGLSSSSKNITVVGTLC